MGTDAKIEVLLLKRKEDNIWETLVKPGKKCKVGTRNLLWRRTSDRRSGGYCRGRKPSDQVFTMKAFLKKSWISLGQMPLPPYITHQLQDKNRYQTVYAKHDGSAAAPTAGLHFTPELLEQIQDKGVKIAHVTLHVGLGTFRPVKVEDVTEHHMHSEFYMVEEDQAKLINDTKAGRRPDCVQSEPPAAEPWSRPPERTAF